MAKMDRVPKKPSWKDGNSRRPASVRKKWTLFEDCYKISASSAIHDVGQTVKQTAEGMLRCEPAAGQHAGVALSRINRKLLSRRSIACDLVSNPF